MKAKPWNFNMDEAPKNGTIVDLKGEGKIVLTEEWWMDDTEAPDGGFWICQLAYGGKILAWRECRTIPFVRQGVDLGREKV